LQRSIVHCRPIDVGEVCSAIGSILSVADNIELVASA
jgi:hypothetical protein